MPPVDLALLGTIVITAVVGGAVGYATHWLQTRRQRKWQKIDEVHRDVMRFVREVQKSLLDIADFAILNEQGSLAQSEVVEKSSKLNNDVNQIVSTIPTVTIVKDAELIELYLEMIDEYKKLIVSLTTQLSSGEGEKLWDTIGKTVIALSSIGTRIDERFDQLKSRVW